VDLRVDRDGTVEHASVGRSSGFAVLDSAAVTVARRSRFRVETGGDGLRGQLRYRFILEDPRERRRL
jgi:TonB family protein